MRTALKISALMFLSLWAGCKSTGTIKPLPTGRELLSVDFKADTPLKYRFVCSRSVNTDWDPENKSPTSRSRTASSLSEKLQMDVVYKPVRVDPLGSTVIEATCQSVRATRTQTGQNSQPNRSNARDAVEYAANRTFKLTIDASGKIEDYSELDALIKELGQKAFRQDTSRGLIKEPDMIGDFVVTQWFLWDAIASIANPSKGVAQGQSWSSSLSVPSPMVMRKARKVDYTLSEIRSDSKGRLAVIKSTHTAAESAPADWPIPYSGRFQLAGTFGFLSGYTLLELNGAGEELFNIDHGRIERYDHRYQMKLRASIPLGISAKPLITINQTISMTRMN